MKRLAAHVHPPVLEGLSTDWMRQAAAALDVPPDAAATAVEYYCAIGRAFNLPGESEPYSVYRFTFADGAAYVGLTGRDVLKRIEEHFGAGERGNGIGNLAIVGWAARGAWRVEVLASGLSRDDAMALERREIRSLSAALNVQNTTTRARDLHDPARGAIAEFYGARRTAPEHAATARNLARIAERARSWER